MAAAPKSQDKKVTKPKVEKAPKAKPLTRAQAEKAMKDNQAAYDAYQAERNNGVERSKNKHSVGYKAFKVAYRQLLEIKRAAGEITPRSAKAEAPVAEPVDVDVAPLAQILDAAEDQEAKAS